MKPSQKYAELMEQPGFVVDPAQQSSIMLLDDLFERLVSAEPVIWWRRVFSPRGTYQPLRGLYFWGGVGRGKTLLMDIFYQSLPGSVARDRTHFHSFMNRVHAQLRELEDVDHPLRAVAASIAAETQVLCLDEFVIIDIGDAMIVAGLLQALFAEGVVLVTTSNAAPENLYKDGLQRARFLPAIDLLQRHCEVVNLDGQQDYRLRFLEQTDLYRVPHDATTDDAIRGHLDQHIKPLQVEQRQLTINGRLLSPRFCAEDTVWFDFTELCETARSQNDYLELARLFNTMVLTGIRVLTAADDDVARRFVLLIDVLYDHHVKLICSADSRPEQLYQGKRLAFEFERTASRLIEMQSSQYLSKGHTLQ